MKIKNSLSKSALADVVVQKRDILNNIVILFYHKVKRFVLVHFRRHSVRESLHLREGTCDQCGQCCKIVIHCPFLTAEDGHTSCRIYKFRPLQCRAFPLNEHDMDDIEYKCSYRFKNNDDA